MIWWGAMTTWAPLLVASAACYAIKLAGVSLPERLLDDPRVQRTVPLLPVALLAALIATQTFASGHRLVIDVRAAALAVALVAVLLRAPFLVVVAAAAATAALLRLLASA
jgi:branched-subunit amino acid transport protein